MRPLAFAMAILLAGFARAESPPSPNVADARGKSEDLVSRMTLDEKVAQLANTAPAIPRLGIPSYNWWTESLHGAIGAVETTNFPEPIGLAATFDTSLVKQVAGTISVEVRGLHALARRTGHMGSIGNGLDSWSPNINIFRDPRWGRGQETYGEDPYLTARLAVAFVSGIQGPNPDAPDVIATPKHFAVHSGPESTRHVANVFVSPHDLEDTYWPAFRAAVTEGHAGSVMCAYNRVNGQPACASDLLLKDTLRGAWGFQGYVVSDCGAIADIADNHKYASDAAAAVAAALKAGVDNDCVFDPGKSSALFKEAYRRGLISAADLDRALIRLFSARLLNGDLADLSGGKRREVPPDEIGAPAHGELARLAAAESLVLLKNDGVLPLKPKQRILLVGPHGDATHMLRGNYASPLSAPPVSILDGLRQALPDAEIIHLPFQPTLMDGDSIPAAALQAPSGEPGLKAEYFNAIAGSDRYESRPAAVRIEEGVGPRGGSLAEITDGHRVVWSGYLVPPETGDWRIGLAGTGEVELNGKRLAKQDKVTWGEIPKLKPVRLEKGKRYPIRVSHESNGSPEIELLWKRVDAQWARHLKAAAANADLIVAAVGLSSALEGEESSLRIEGFSGGDKTSLDLPAEQRRLLRQAGALGKPLVVVLANGSPIDLSWEKANASAILEAWYPGQAGGQAIADVLSGRANPAGRLPLTFYKSVADLPPFEDYAMAGRTYRYFEGQPVYPFGYGLSYTRFAYEDPTLEPIDGSFEHGARVKVNVANIGERQGDEVVQLYVKPPPFEGAPRLALRGFTRLSLAPGERRMVSFDLSQRDLSFVTRDGKRQTFRGRYEVNVGSGQPETGVPVRSVAFTMTEETHIE